MKYLLKKNKRKDLLEKMKKRNEPIDLSINSFTLNKLASAINRDSSYIINPLEDEKRKKEREEYLSKLINDEIDN